MGPTHAVGTHASSSHTGRAWVDAGGVDDLPDARGRDRVPEAGQFAVDAPVSMRREPCPDSKEFTTTVDPSRAWPSASMADRQHCRGRTASAAATGWRALTPTEYCRPRPLRWCS